MNFFDTKDKPLILYAGLAATSLMILAGTGVALTVMTPIFIVLLSPILVSAVITLSLLTTAFLAYGSFVASSIALFFLLYMKEEQYLHARGTQPEEANKLVRGNNPAKEDKPDKLAEGNKPPGRDQKKLVEEDKQPVRDETPEGNKSAEEDHKPDKRAEKLVEEEKPPVRDEMPEENKSAEEETSLGGGDQAKEKISISEISKVLL